MANKDHDALTAAGSLDGTERVHVKQGANSRKATTQAIANLVAPGVSGDGVPCGRLTLTSNTPVMTADVTGASSVYYTPFRGNNVPIYSGTAWNLRAFTQLTLSLDTSNHLSGSLYDVFVWSNAGVVSIGTGPSWVSGTSRDTGAGTTELELKDGVWTNKNSITLRNGAGAGTSGIAANTATYVGTIYCTANGQTGMAFKPAAAAGGGANILGVYNAYNHVTVRAQSRDSTASWTYASNTWRAMNNNNANRISFVDGLQQSSIIAFHTIAATGNATGVAGVNLDSTSATPAVTGQNSSASASTGSTITVADTFPPQIGFHFIQAMEGAAGTITFYGAQSTPSRQLNSMTVELDM